MKPRSTERGVVVLLLVVLISLAGSVLLGVNSLRVSTPAHHRALNLKADLLHAHKALISYTVHYPYLYGARGSGTGHFPCPDLDGKTEPTGTAWSLRLGPNPPCGQHAAAEGWLPAHISFPNHRYSFDADRSAPVSYRVSGLFVNNPVNRVVNPAVMLNAQQASLPVVELYQTATTNEDSYTGSTRAVITPIQMLLSTKPSVASWFVNRLGHLGSLNCSVSSIQGLKTLRVSLNDSNNLSDGMKPVLDEWCQHVFETIKRCSASIPSPATPIFMHRRGLVDELSIESTTYSQFLTFLMADEYPDNYDCETVPEAQLHIEGVLAKSHWFVRNRWAPWIKLVIDEGCYPDLALPCKFVKFAEHSNRNSPILVHWGLE